MFSSGAKSPEHILPILSILPDPGHTSSKEIILNPETLEILTLLKSEMSLRHLKTVIRRKKLMRLILVKEIRTSIAQLT